MAEVVGYAAVFRLPSRDLGFIETVEPDAFADADMTDVLASRDHDDRLLLAHVKSGTLKLSIDSVGLAYAFELADSPLAHDVRASVKRGDIVGASFAFRVASDGDEWAVDESTGTVVRRILSIAEVYDVTLTPRPAYEHTTARLREQR